MTIEIIRRPMSRARLASLAEAQFGDMVKAVVDVERGVMAIGGELHSDEEAALIEDGSAHSSRRLFGSRGGRRRDLFGRLGKLTRDGSVVRRIRRCRFRNRLRSRGFGHGSQSSSLLV